jgi:hypothetical protein
LASVIVDRTHTAHGSGMGAAAAAISPLGLDLDLIKQRVLVRMRGGVRRETVVLRKDGRSRRQDGGAREESDCKATGVMAAIATTTGRRRG